MNEKFTDQQMALILKRAAESQAAGDEPTHSLESIQELARQVGIDPLRVADAAAALHKPETSALFGAPSAFRESRRVDETVHAIDKAQLLSTIRDYLAFAGEPRNVGDGIEWHGGPGDNKTVVSIAPSESGTVVRVDVRQHGPKVGSFLGAAAAGLLCVLVGGAVWSVPGAAVGVGALAGSLAATRALWNRHVTRRDRRLRELMNALVEKIEG